MFQKNLYDIAIIGGGASGLNAAIYATRSNLKTILLERGLYGGQLNLTDEVENYLGVGKISGSELAMKFIDHANLYNFHKKESEVTNLKKNKYLFELTLSNTELIQSKVVILATGGKPRKLNIPGEKKFYGNGVSYCATCDGFFFKNKTVSVIGGGDSAAEEALSLSKLCKKVNLIYRSNNLSASKLAQKRLEENSKITILKNLLPVKINSHDNELSGLTVMNVKTKTIKEIESDGIFVFIGYEPNNNLLPKKIELDSRGMVITNELCETNIEGLYAVGDLRSKPARQIILSAADGCNAAIAAAKYIESTYFHGK